MLSDAWFNKSKFRSKFARLGFTQSLDKFEYFWTVFTILSHYSSNLPYLRIRKRRDNLNYSLEFYTRSISNYVDKKKLFRKQWILSSSLIPKEK